MYLNIFSVHQLQVSDIKVIAAMGDAFTVSNMFKLTAVCLFTNK